MMGLCVFNNFGGLEYEIRLLVELDSYEAFLLGLEMAVFSVSACGLHSVPTCV